MARAQRSSTLNTRTSRLKLKVPRRASDTGDGFLDQSGRKFLTIGKGLALGYRRTEDGYGTWQARVWNGVRYQYRNLGVADDFQDANGIDVLDFYQAQGVAREFFELATKGHMPGKEITVNEAAGSYLDWYRDHRRASKETESAIRAHILPALGDHKVGDLTAPQLRAWLEKIAKAPARIRSGKSKKQRTKPAPKTDEDRRRRQATANRVLNVLKALLNKAFHDGLVADNTAWRQVKRFKGADEARVRFLTDAEATRLVNACSADLRPLVQAALLTGARYGELTAMQACDVNLKTAQVYIARSKSGKPRYVPLNPEGLALFKDQLRGLTGDAFVFTKKDGTAWGKNHHVRLLTDACKAAKVRPAVAFHELRHTYASHLAQAGVDLLTISKLLGHADTRMTSKHYAHLADKTLAAAVTRLPSFGARAAGLEPVPGKAAAAG
jgi:integrase